MKKSQFLSLLLACGILGVDAQTFDFGTKSNPAGETFEVDSKGFVVNGKHVLPVMGEIHYSRVPQSEWRREIQKMKAGGITVLSTYVFWIHHEAEEGKWDWSGNRNLHEFVKICGEEGMPVVLRIGPFCHGEVFQGGFPVWIVDKSIEDAKQYKLRSLAPGFIAATQRLYSNIYAQVSDLLWKHGGPIVGVQIENECRGPWSYYSKLKEMAVSVGFDVPFYTRTGWPKLNGKEVFGEMLPLYGDYADGFWDRTLKDMPGEYAKAFIMKDTRLSGVIATETFGTNQDTKMEQKDLQYPYLTCELGGGMMQSYHRRINMSGNEPFPLAVCKVGSGSNLPGYYMYHGGTNPNGPEPNMAECQASRTTAHNDLPHLSYDFQSPLGEMGQLNAEAWHQTRWFHQFLKDWGEELSQLDVDSLSEQHARRGSFIFRNDYVRILNENGSASVSLEDWQDGNLSLTTIGIQPFARTEGTFWFIPVKNAKVQPLLCVNGKKYRLKQDRPLQIQGRTFQLLSDRQARAAYVIDGKMYFANHPDGILLKDGNNIVEQYWSEGDAVDFKFQAEAKTPREVKNGGAKVAEQPSEEDWQRAALYTIDITNLVSNNYNIAGDDAPSNITDLASNGFLKICYNADCARVYADGQLVEDNFWNGKPMLVRLSDLAGKKVELRLLPFSKDYPIYLQQAQKELAEAAPNGILCELKSISLLLRNEEIR